MSPKGAMERGMGAGSCAAHGDMHSRDGVGVATGVVVQAEGLEVRWLEVHTDCML